MSEEKNGIRKEVSKGNLSVSKVSTSAYQKQGTKTAELRQIVTTKSFYPTKSVANNLQDNPFSMADFGFQETEYENKETRVAWIDVPEALTVEHVQAKLNAIEGATLYRILSNRPIVTDNQLYAINDSELDVSMDDFSNRQAVRYPDSDEERAGQLALDSNGKVQYRAIFFSNSPVEDSDLRTEDITDMYVSAEIIAELNNVAHVVEGQGI